jgi:hypothetical protein
MQQQHKQQGWATDLKTMTKSTRHTRKGSKRHSIRAPEFPSTKAHRIVIILLSAEYKMISDLSPNLFTASRNINIISLEYYLNDRPSTHKPTP